MVNYIKGVPVTVCGTGTDTGTSVYNGLKKTQIGITNNNSVLIFNITHRSQEEECDCDESGSNEGCQTGIDNLVAQVTPHRGCEGIGTTLDYKHST